MDAVRGLLEVSEINRNLSSVFKCLFNDHVEGENLLNA